MRSRIVPIHSLAPPKPAPGAACNGCGVCCSWQPCPLGMLISLRWRGPCAALRWSASDRRYLCAVVAAGKPQPATRGAWWRRLSAAAARRWIAAGQGCDSDLIAEPPQAPG